MAARCWRPAAGPRSAHRRPKWIGRNGCGDTDLRRCIPQAAGRTGLDRWSQHPHRLSLGCRQRRAHATVREGLFQLNPEVIFTFTTPATAALQAETSTIPIVFAASDPIGSGFVASLANPGGNMTGFINFEASLGANGSSCCMRLLRAFRALRSCSTRKPHRLLVIIWQRSDPLRLRLPSSRSRPPFTVLPRSSLP